MKGLKFKIISGIFILIIVCLFLLLKIYNKPHTDVRNVKSDIITNVENLLAEYEQDEALANKKYTDQIIQVNGTIFEISNLRGNMVITLKNPKSKSSIICHFLPEDYDKSLILEKGQNVTIKGVCTGFLLDVILVRCVIVK